MAEKIAVLGVYSDYASVENAVDVLKEAGFRNTGIPEHAAKRYEVRVKEGGILLSVHSDNAEWTKRAKELLERTGAEDISVTGVGGADYLRSERPATRGGTV